jgi:hypothetical protein
MTQCANTAAERRATLAELPAHVRMRRQVDAWKCTDTHVRGSMRQTVRIVMLFEAASIKSRSPLGFTFT